jgi:hypothetical protein
LKVAFLGACCVLFAAAGCGSSSSPDAASDGSAPTTSARTPTNAADPTHAEINTSWMLMFGHGGDNSTPPQKLYGVFEREQTDDEAKIARELVAESSCSLALPESGRHTDYGKPIAEKARILLDEVDSGHDSLVAVLTTAGRVSLAVFPGGGGTCTRPEDDGVIAGAESYGDSVTLYGMVDDHVRSIDVITEGQTHRAKLDQNGFSVALPRSAAEHLGKLVLHRADGSKTEVPLG